MVAKIIDGKSLSQLVRADIAKQAQQLTAKNRPPGLAVILVGHDPASEVYVRNKIKACEDQGFYSICQKYPETLSEQELIKHIEALNQDPNIDGILVQLPLPKHINSHTILEVISPLKDVDGFHVANAGALMTGQALFKPCTPYGIMKMLTHYHIPIEGANAVIIGRSNIVGKPIAMLLLNEGATVTICHSKTKSLAQHTKQADIIIVATGKRHLLTADMVKPGATVIDVGIHRDEHGKLSGDVDFDAIKDVAGWITPVPGGVGPMTITMLLMNTLEAAKRAQQAL